MIRNNLFFYEQKAAEWWREHATIAPLNRLNPLRFQYFDQSNPDWSGLKVLDVGCGGGFTCEYLAKRGATVWGMDQSSTCIEAAKPHARLSNLDIHWSCISARLLKQMLKTVFCPQLLHRLFDVLGAVFADDQGGIAVPHHHHIL